MFVLVPCILEGKTEKATSEKWMIWATVLGLWIPATLELAFASVDITPPEPLPLGGYTERGDKVMKGVQDRLTARALFLRQGEIEVVFISAEMLTVPQSLSRAVEKKIFPKGGGHLFMSATHTHCAPDSQLLNERMTFKIPGIASYNPFWLQWYAERIAEVAKARFHYQTIKEIRLLQTKASLNHPRGFSRKVDSRVTQVRFVLENGEYVELLHYSAHPTVYGPDMMKTAGDFPGEWLKRGEKRLFFNGAMGDVAPAIPDGLAGKAGAKAMALALERAVKEAENHNPKRGTLILSPLLRFIRLPIALPSPVPHPEFAGRFSAPPLLARQLIQAFAPREASLWVVQVGPLVFLGVPGEPTAEVGQELETALRKRGVLFPLVVSFVNDWIGYIVSEPNYSAGGYEASLSFYGAGLADVLIQALGFWKDGRERGALTIPESGCSPLPSGVIASWVGSLVGFWRRTVVGALPALSPRGDARERREMTCSQAGGQGGSECRTPLAFRTVRGGGICP
ncbi:MAG: hypothetical protein QXI19_10810 [Candidatus Caldarchaeum sp.]